MVSRRITLKTQLEQRDKVFYLKDVLKTTKYSVVINTLLNRYIERFINYNGMDKELYIAKSVSEHLDHQIIGRGEELSFRIKPHIEEKFLFNITLFDDDDNIRQMKIEELTDILRGALFYELSKSDFDNFEEVDKK